MSTPLTIALTPGYVYTQNEVDTASKRNALGNPTIQLLGSIGTLAIADGSVTTPKLVDGVLSANAAGQAKMAPGYFSADTTGRAFMADGYLTAVKAEETFREGCQQYFATSSGSGTAYVVTLTPAATLYNTGMRVAFKVDTTNTAAVTLNVNGLGAQSLCSIGAIALAAGQLVAGQIVEAIYDGTNFQLVNGVALFISGPTAVAGGLMVNDSHGLGAVPTRCRWVLRCISAELAFSVGDEVDIENFGFTNGTAEFRALQSGQSATKAFLNCGNAGVMSILRKDTQVAVNITNAKWNAVGYISL